MMGEGRVTHEKSEAIVSTSVVTSATFALVSFSWDNHGLVDLPLRASLVTRFGLQKLSFVSKTERMDGQPGQRLRI